MSDAGRVLMMRVSVPDHPGALGAVATAIGALGADIRAVHIVEKGGGSAINDFVVQLPTDVHQDIMVTACQRLTGVRVEWLAPHPSGGNLQSDLETAGQMAADPARAAELLTESAPIVFGADWSLLLDVTADPVVRAGSPVAPVVSPAALTRLAPFDVAHLVDLPEHWLPGARPVSAAVVPLSRQRTLVVVRAGPRFREPELARLRHLATLVG